VFAGQLMDASDKKYWRLQVSSPLRRRDTNGNMKKRALINYRIPAAANSVFILHDIHLINLAPPVFVVPFYLHVNQPHRCENINTAL
jgi:hypothetical protein